MSSTPRHAANLDRPQSKKFQESERDRLSAGDETYLSRESLNLKVSQDGNGCRQLRQLTDVLTVKCCPRGSV